MITENSGIFGALIDALAAEIRTRAIHLVKSELISHSPAAETGDTGHQTTGAARTRHRTRAVHRAHLSQSELSSTALL